MAKNNNINVNKSTGTVKPKDKTQSSKAYDDKVKKGENAAAATVKSPIVFSEDDYSVQYHDLKVFIQGVEVSQFISGSLKVDYSLSGYNQASFTLDNAGDKFTITEENLKDWDITSIYNATGIFQFRKQDIKSNISYNQVQKDTSNNAKKTGVASPKTTARTSAINDKAKVAAKQQQQQNTNIATTIDFSDQVGLFDSYSEIPKAKIYAFKVGIDYKDTLKYVEETLAILDREMMVMNYEESKQPQANAPVPPPISDLPPFDTIWPNIKNNNFDIYTSKYVKKDDIKNKLYVSLYSDLHAAYLIADPTERMKKLKELEGKYSKYNSPKLKGTSEYLDPFKNYTNTYFKNYMQTKEYQAAYGDYYKKLAEYEKQKLAYSNVGNSYNQSYVKDNELGAVYANTELDIRNKVIIFVFNVLKKIPLPKNKSEKNYYAERLQPTIKSRVYEIFSVHEQEKQKIDAAIAIAYEKFFNNMGRPGSPTTVSSSKNNKINAYALTKPGEKLNILDTDTGEYVWAFGVGRTVFHKTDPVRIFIHNPYSDYYADEWLPKFTGYLENITVTKDHLNGGSTLSVTCVDMRKLMARMRVQLNPIIPQGNQLPERVPLYTDPTSFFRDFLLFAPKRTTNQYKKLSLEQIFDRLLLYPGYKLGRFKAGYKQTYPVESIDGTKPPELTFELVYLKNKLEFVDDVYKHVIKQQQEFKTSLSEMDKIFGKATADHLIIHNDLDVSIRTYIKNITEQRATLVSAYGGTADKSKDELYSIYSDYLNLITDADTAQQMQKDVSAVEEKLQFYENEKKAILDYQKRNGVFPQEEKRLQELDKVIAEEKAKTEKRITSNKDYIKEFNDSLLVKLNSIEEKTKAYSQQLDTKIKKYENDLKAIKKKIKEYQEQQVKNLKELERNKKVLEQWHLLTLLGIVPITQEGLLTGNSASPTQSLLKQQFRFMTEKEVDFIGRLCYTGGPWAPDNSYFHKLLPKNNGLANLVAYQFNAGSAKIEWGYRSTMLSTYADIVDYKWYITPIGDIVLEFPMYDFYPQDFGKNLENIFNVNHGLINTTYGDENGDVPTTLIAYGSLDSNKNKDANQYMPDDFKVRVWFWSNILRKRFGVVELAKTYDFIDDKNILIRMGLIAMQREINSGNSMQLSMISKEFLGLNRPLFSIHDMRMGHVDTLSWSYTIDGDEEMSVDLRQVRSLRTDFTFRFVSGGASLPISYRDFYGLANIGDVGTYQGISWRYIAHGPNRTSSGNIRRTQISFKKEVVSTQYSSIECKQLKELYDFAKKKPFSFPEVPMFGNGMRLPKHKIICGFGGWGDANIARSYTNLRAYYKSPKLYYGTQIGTVARLVKHHVSTIILHINFAIKELYKVDSKMLLKDFYCKNGKPNGAEDSNKVRIYNAVRQYGGKNLGHDLPLDLTVAQAIKKLNDSVNEVFNTLVAKNFSDTIWYDNTTANTNSIIFFDAVDTVFAILALIPMNADYTPFYWDRKVAPERASIIATPLDRYIPGDYTMYHNPDFLKTSASQGGNAEAIDSHGNDYVLAMDFTSKSSKYVATIIKEVYTYLNNNLNSIPGAQYAKTEAFNYSVLYKGKAGTTTISAFLDRMVNGAPLKYNFYFMLFLYYDYLPTFNLSEKEKKHYKISLWRNLQRAFFRSRLCVLTPSAADKNGKKLAVFRLVESRDGGTASGYAHETSYNGCAALDIVSHTLVESMFYIKPPYTNLDKNGYIKALLDPAVWDVAGVTWTKSPAGFNNPLCGPCPGSVALPGTVKDVAKTVQDSVKGVVNRLSGFLK